MLLSTSAASVIDIENPENDALAPRVLSIQSSVVFGHVGNASSAFALQTLGFDAALLHSVQLSTHTGYPFIRGSKLSGDDVRTLIEGLRMNGVLGLFSGVVSGYIASSGVLDAVADGVRTLRAVRSAAGITLPPFFVMDPVLGDYDADGVEGRLYVPAEVVGAMRAAIRDGCVSLLTPNSFEAEILTERPKIFDRHSAIATMDALHLMGARAVIITSSFVYEVTGSGSGSGSGSSSGSGSGIGGRSIEDAGANGSPSNDTAVPTMIVFCSAPWADVETDVGEGAAPHIDVIGDAARRNRLWPNGPTSSSHARFAVRVPRLPGSFTGTGDLLSALLLAHGVRAPGGLVRAVEAALATTFAVCDRTARARDRGVASAIVSAAASAAGADATASAKAGASAACELRLVESKRDIERPKLRFDMQAFALD